MNTVLLLCILQLIAGLPLVAGVGPWCFQCHNLFHPAGCMQITACGDNEACYTEKHSVNGVSQFSSGCKPIADCSKVVKRSTTVECVECCTGSACNEALCGADLFSNKTRKWCADCTKQTDPTACDHVKLCPHGDSCTVKKISLFGRTIYDLDCEKPAACQGKTLAGNNQMCCDEHLCNTNLAGSSPDTYTTTPSPAAATADINETSIAYVSHHDPNDTLTITCHVTGYPTPNVTWFFIPDANSTNVTGTTPTTTITGNSVTTTPAGSTSVGGQSATTTTPVGGATAGGGSTVASSTVAATTTGSTGGSTAAVVSSTSGGTSAGTAVTTTTASLTGTSPGQQQRTEITSGVTTSNGVSTLVITVPDETDAGQYVCHVDNGQATDESNVTVTYSAAPLIQGPKNETVDNDVRDDVILDCQTEGAPTPQVLWILPPDAGGAEHLANGSLLLHNVHGDNTGQYTCIAKNSVGQDAKTFDLNVNDNSTAACRGMGTTLTTTSLLTTLSMPTTTAATSSTASSSSSSSSSTTAATQASITTTPFVCPTLPSTTTATTAATSSTPPSTTATTSPPTTPTTTPTTTTPTTTTTVTTPTTASTSTTATTTTTPSPTTPPPTTTTTSTTTTTTTATSTTTTTPKTTIKKSTTPQTTTTTTQVVPSTSPPPSITAVGSLWHDSDKGMAVLQCNAHALPGMTSVPPITWSRLEENYNHSDTKTYTENGHGVLVIMPHDQSAAPSGVYQCHVFGGSDNDTAEFAVYKEIPGPIDCRQSFDVGTPAPGTVLRTTCGKCQSGPVRSSHLIWRDQICHSAAGRGLIPQTGGVVAWMLKKNNEVALLKEENGHVKLIT